MPPKKKGAKKGTDDWEADLGETPASVTASTNGHEEEPPQEGEDNEGPGVGGLLAALKKNKTKKAKKGKLVQDDYVDGGDLLDANETDDLASKAPQEATAEDLFATPTKNKGAKGKQKAEEKVAESGGEESGGEGGTLKSKKEKEKERKEREKQRKKEQVSRLQLSRMWPFS
jgi:translation initiation factor 5B